MTAAAFRQQVRVFLDSAMSPQQRSARLAEVAKEGVAKLIQERRASPRYRRFVDGREGVPEEAVRPDGRIAYQFQYMAEIIVFALEFMRARGPGGPARTPVTSRNYDRQAWRDSFILGLDGKFVPMQRFNPGKMGPVSEVIITNSRPYHRKAEIQYVGTKRLQFSVDPGTFLDARDAIKGRFGNMVTVEWKQTVHFPGQYRLKGDQLRKHHRGGQFVGTSFRRRAGEPVESPALIITAR